MRENKGAWNDFDRADGRMDAGAVPKHADQIIDPNGQEGEAAGRKAPSLPPSTSLPDSGQKGRLALIRTDRSPNQDFLAFVIRPSLPLTAEESGEEAHHSLPDSPLLGWFKMSNQQCLTNASLAGIRKGGWPVLCASPRRNLPGEREGNGEIGAAQARVDWWRGAGWDVVVTHASLMGWTDWTCVIQMPRTNINTLATKPFRKRCTNISLGKSRVSQNSQCWIRKVQGTKLRTSHNAKII